MSEEFWPRLDHPQVHRADEIRVDAFRKDKPLPSRVYQVI